MNLITAAILASTLVACTNQPPHYVFAPDPDLTPDQIAVLHTAAAQWNAVSDIPISFDQNGLFIRLAPMNPGTQGLDYASEGIEIAPNLKPDRFYNVALHEFGHAIGLQHINHPGVMDPQATQHVFSTEDLTECHRVGACH